MTPCILVLEDESAVLAVVQQTLGSEGYQVVTARSLAQFRKLDTQHEADIYLIDVSLPDGNGFALVRELRRSSDRGIITLTGRGRDAEDVAGLESGADDSIGKPLRERELAARVNAVYRRTAGRPTAARAGQQADHEFDGYRFSLPSRQLWGPDGAEIALTSSEFELLAALISRRGEVLSRDQIMNAVKGGHWESYDRVVDGIISRLRRKIPARTRSTPFIRTVHGVGYAFTG
ncbi:DNA-binding response regulator [Cereibacter changlensis JA139]|uniref:DNA-binding response regulator n=2 Tax=Cereibacter changlensis TaxID=402884 RepID=A0A2T4K093_9RHOB|nr:response regulator transcription factor [Cereibacter changlensis]PTE23568.1 DNA-binding response regulator [Cereibacter changlensis JA139]PZX58513.1 two-component system torCAD operon response regulator TorR [Cereibacter changlensis]